MDWFSQFAPETTVAKQPGGVGESLTGATSSRMLRPQLDRLFAVPSHDFKSFSDPVETSLRNAMGDANSDKAIKYQNSLKPSEDRHYSALHFGLDRLQGTSINAKRGNYSPVPPMAETSLRNALADIGSKKAIELQMANKELAKGNIEFASFILGRKLTDSEKATGTVDFIRERELAKAKAEQAKIAASTSVFSKQKRSKVTGYLRDGLARPYGAFILPSQYRLPQVPQTPQPPQQGAPKRAKTPPPVTRRVPPHVPGRAANAKLSQEEIDFIQAVRLDKKTNSQRYAPATEAKRINDRLQKFGSNAPPVLSTTASYDGQLATLQQLGYTGKGLALLRPFGAKTSEEKRSVQRENAELGRYLLDKKKLGSSNILSFTHKNGHSVTDLPQYKIGHSLKAVILAILHGMPVNLDDLNEEDMRAFNMLMKKTGCVNGVHWKNPISNNNDAMMTRLKVLVGEIGAGNDSKSIKTELSQTLNSLQEAKLLSAKQVKEATKRYIMMG